MKRTTSRILRMLLCYLLFCGFVWAFLTVQMRSHNRLSHEPAAMAQLVCCGETVALHLPDQSYQWETAAAGFAVAVDRSTAGCSME